MSLLPIALLAALMVYLSQRLVRSGLRSDGTETWLGLTFVPPGFGIVPRFAVATGIAPVAVNLFAQLILHTGMLRFAAFVWHTLRPIEAAWRRVRDSARVGR